MNIQERFTEKLTRKFQGFKDWALRKHTEHPVPPIPAYQGYKHFQREEYMQMGIVLIYTLLLVGFPTYVEPLLRAVFQLPPAISQGVSWLCVGATALLIYELKRGHEDKLKSAVYRYDLWEGEIRELTEEGIMSYPYQLWVESIMELHHDIEQFGKVTDDDGKTAIKKGELKDKDGNWLVKETDKIYLVNCAYRDDDDVLRQLIIITDSNLSEHERLTVSTRAYQGVWGINREASKINFVVVRRTLAGNPIMYITDSAIEVSRVANREERQVAELPPTLMAEFQLGIMEGERAMNLVANLEAQRDEANRRARNWQLMYHRKTGNDIREGGVIGPEVEPKTPLFSSRQKQYLTTFLIIVATIVIVYGIGNLLGWWIPFTTPAPVPEVEGAFKVLYRIGVGYFGRGFSSFPLQTGNWVGPVPTLLHSYGGMI